MSFKRWVFSTPYKEEAVQLSQDTGINAFLLFLLTMRGFHTAEDIAEFMLGGPLSDDPFAFADMDLAVARIQKALDTGEMIAIFGDYDADGVTATTLLYSYLRDRGARVTYLVPKREGTGYGMHPEVVDALAERGATLIITVDNGIAAVEETAYAAEKGIDVVITDHHQPQDTLPAAVAVVDPHRPDCGSSFKDYAGVGVAFKLVCALEGDDDSVLERYADLVAVGTLADVMPLRGENRLLVREGLRRLNEQDRPGFEKLAEAAGLAGKALTATNAVFTIAPRINAAGRMGAADKAVRLLLEEDPGRALELAEEIQAMNGQRQSVEADILLQADALLAEHPAWRRDRVLVLCGHRWHNGVVGIIAARLTDRYGKPCIVFSEDDGIAKGSGRSVKGFSLFEAISACAELTESFGGHELAAGVKINAQRLDEFRETINRYAASRYPVMPVPELQIDCKLAPSQVDTEKLGLLSALEPTGTGNPVPLFGLFHMRLDNILPVGGGKHLRLSVSRDNVRLAVMKFKSTPQNFSIPCGSMVDIVVTMERNEFRGVVSPSLIVQDIRPSSIDQEALLAGLSGFERVMRRELTPEEARTVVLPERDRLAGFYRLLRARPVWEGTFDQLCLLAGDGCGEPMTLLLMLEILQEAHLIIWTDRGIVYTIETPKAAGKADLSQTPTMRYLQKAKEDAL